MDILDLSPDLYTRNIQIRRLVDCIRDKSQLRVLNVGGSVGHMDLFFPEDELYTMDLLPPQENKQENYVIGDIRRAPYKNNAFDVAICTDVCEHIPPEDRLNSISELLRLSKNYVIVGAPFYSEAVLKSEIAINEFFVKKTGQHHPYLKEHLEYPLPLAEEFESFFTGIDYEFYKLATNNISNWLLLQFLISYSLQNGDMPASRIKEIYHFYNENFIELGDFLEPTYRTIYLVGKRGTLPQIELKQSQNIDELEIQKLTLSVFGAIIESSALSDAKINSLQDSLERKSAQINSLQDHLERQSAQIHQIQRTIGIQLLSRYQMLVDRLMPSGTRRRYYYELKLAVISVLVNEGWRSLWLKARGRLKKNFKRGF